MATIHFILQKKGGIGKTFIAFLLAQYFQEIYGKCICYDTDPLNESSGLISIPRLNVHPFKFVDSEGNFEKKQLDVLMEQILANEEDDNIVIDNGSTSFNPITSYIKDTGALELLHEYGHTVYAHCILGAGKELNDTTKGTVEISNIFENVVIWINPFWGEVIVNGKRFTDTAFYMENSHKYHAIINLPTYSVLFKYDLMKMLGKRITFQQALKGDHEGELFTLMQRQRLIMIWRQIKQECIEPAEL